MTEPTLELFEMLVPSFLTVRASSDLFSRLSPLAYPASTTVRIAFRVSKISYSLLPLNSKLRRTKKPPARVGQQRNERLAFTLIRALAQCDEAPREIFFRKASPIELALGVKA